MVIAEFFVCEATVFFLLFPVLATTTTTFYLIVLHCAVTIFIISTCLTLSHNKSMSTFEFNFRYPRKVWTFPLLRKRSSALVRCSNGKRGGICCCKITLLSLPLQVLPMLFHRNNVPEEVKLLLYLLPSMPLYFISRTNLLHLFLIVVRLFKNILINPELLTYHPVAKNRNHTQPTLHLSGFSILNAHGGRMRYAPTPNKHRGAPFSVRPDAFMGICFSISHLNRKNCGRP